MRYFFFILTIFTLVAFIVPSAKAQAGIPRVFIFGDYEEEYNLLQQEYETNLLEVCDDDMMIAFGKLTSMYQEMEAYADQIAYDINGVRLWIHAFWGEDGAVEYIAFQLRPNSRKVEADDIETFLLGFISQYRFPLISDVKYTLQTYVSFPTFSKQLSKN